jgi:predicted methyltransferase
MQSQSLCLRSFMFLLASLAFADSATAQLLSEAQRQQLQTLIESPDRGAGLQARNQYRNPLETLDLFEVTPDLTVVEIWHGGQGGRYRSILEPYIQGNGIYIPVRESPEFPASVPQVAANSADCVLVFRAHGFMIYEHPAQDYFDALYGLLKPGGIVGIVDHRGNEDVLQDPKS